MADDIVIRLRVRAAYADDDYLSYAAADEIERLRTEVERLRAALLKYGTRWHYECEDSWYSCPRSADGCVDDRWGDKCNCGADEHNAEVRAIAIQEARCD